jgi:4-hydroxybenzoate polyprenyltransferase
MIGDKVALVVTWLLTIVSAVLMTLCFVYAGWLGLFWFPHLLGCGYISYVVADTWRIQGHIEVYEKEIARMKSRR